MVPGSEGKIPDGETFTYSFNLYEANLVPSSVLGLGDINQPSCPVTYISIRTNDA